MHLTSSSVKYVGLLFEDSRGPQLHGIKLPPLNEQRNRDRYHLGLEIWKRTGIVWTQNRERTPPNFSGGDILGPQQGLRVGISTELQMLNHEKHVLSDLCKFSASLQYPACTYKPGAA